MLFFVSDLSITFHPKKVPALFNTATYRCLGNVVFSADKKPKSVIIAFISVKNWTKIPHVFNKRNHVALSTIGPIFATMLH